MTGTREGMDRDKEIGSVEHMVLSNCVTLLALVELLEEKGILTTDELVNRMKQVRHQPPL